MPTTRKIKYFLFNNEDDLFLNENDLFLNEEEPHWEQTIFPPKDRSETIEELPQNKQTLFKLITK